MLIKIILAILLYHTSCDGKRYENYTLFRGIPTNEDQLEFFNSLSQIYDVVYWRRAGMLNRPVDFSVGPSEKQDFLETAQDNGISLTTVIEDIQSAFDRQTVKTYIRRKLHSFNWYSYYRLDDIYSWLQDLVKSFPKELKLINIGTSIEKRDIFAIRLKLQGCTSSSKVIIEGGIHAREWVAPAVVTYMLNEMVHARSSNNKELHSIVMAFEWYFIPIINRWDRLWRKNRRNNHGIDLNRNFEVAFGTVGVNPKDKNDDTYCGPAAFSEPEAKALANFARNYSSNLEYYIAFHSYGQYFIIPYSYTTKYFENYDEVVNMGTYAASRISRKYGTKYNVGNAHTCIGYLASGASTDWVKKVFKTRYVATIELRDTGKHGFSLPPEQILPTCRETLEGMIAFFSPQPALTKLRQSNVGRRNRVFDGIVIVCLYICWL